GHGAPEEDSHHIQGQYPKNGPIAEHEPEPLPQTLENGLPQPTVHNGFPANLEQEGQGQKGKEKNKAHGPVHADPAVGKTRQGRAQYHGQLPGGTAPGRGIGINLPGDDQGDQRKDRGAQEGPDKSPQKYQGIDGVQNPFGRPSRPKSR